MKGRRSPISRRASTEGIRRARRPRSRFRARHFNMRFAAGAMDLRARSSIGPRRVSSGSRSAAPLRMRRLAEAPSDIFFGALYARAREDRRGLIVFDELTHIEEGRIIADARCLLHRVRDDDDRIILLQLADELFDARGGDGIER